YPLDPPTVRRLGAALVRALKHENPATVVRFLVGRDTRESGDWIEEELARGVAGQGGQLTSVGVVPTPAVAYLTPLKGFTAGLVISASHNPFEDNGIKVFSGAGEKFTEALEAEVEAIIADTSWSVAEAHQAAIARVDYRADYEAHLAEILPPALRKPFRIAIDCANGATTTVAPDVFRRQLGLEVAVIGNEPNGRKINLQCGPTSPARLQKTVVDGGID